ncbi:MAG: cupin domain-containing protein [Bacteroidota bacterium]|nr:cupin domain-containing protein [Bacteroidota bacterium]
MRSLIFLAFCFLSSFVMAQVPVSKEPRHHLVFENENARILNVLLPPGDTTQYHLHSTPSVFIMLTHTKTGSQKITNDPVTSTSKAGDIWFENLNPPNTKIHRVWNMDTATYHVVDVELLTKDSGFANPPLTLEHTHIIIDTPWVRVYSIVLAKDQQTTIKGKRPGFILIAINAGNIQLTENNKRSNSTIQPGANFIIEPNTEFSLNNSGGSLMQFALLELHFTADYPLGSGNGNGFGTQVQGVTLPNFANKELTWRKLHKTNIGFDAILFNNTILFTAE